MLLGTENHAWYIRSVRWNQEKSQRFQALREAEARGNLTDPERAELSRLLADLDADEADELHPAMDQAAARVADLAAEKARLEAKADALSRIVAEQERLLADATAYLQTLRERSASLAEDYRRLMGHDLVPAR
jgi:chromosome segregation ATPase